MDKMLKKVINKVIKLEQMNITDFAEVHELDNMEKFDSIGRKVCEILDYMRANLDPKMYRSIFDIVNLKDSESTLYRDYYFKKGVIAGLTDLNFLKEVKNIAYMDILEDD